MIRSKVVDSQSRRSSKWTFFKMNRLKVKGSYQRGPYNTKFRPSAFHYFDRPDSFPGTGNFKIYLPLGWDHQRRWWAQFSQHQTASLLELELCRLLDPILRTDENDLACKSLLCHWVFRKLNNPCVLQLLKRENEECLCSFWRLKRDSSYKKTVFCSLKRPSPKVEGHVSK